MRPLILILILTFLSCGQSETKQKELELKEKELALREQELQLKEKGAKQDTAAVQLTNTQNSIASNPDEMILEIKAEFKRINSLSLTKQTFDVTYNNSPAEGTIDYYLNNNNIVKVVEEEWTDHHYSTNQYYYKDGKFIFSYEVFTAVPLYGPETKTEYRTYVNNDKIIRTMENKSITTPERKGLTSSSKEYKIIKAYATKDFKSVSFE